MKGTYTVAGQRVRTSSQRRFVLFVVYTKTNGGEGVTIYKRTDSREKALNIRANYGWSATRRLVILDTFDGETI